MTESALVLRATRAAVRDHAPRDPLTVATDGLLDRLYMLQETRHHHWHEQARRTVADALTTAVVVGRASDLTSAKYVRAADEIVVRVTYAETWLADYAVAPGLPALCWAD